MDGLYGDLVMDHYRNPRNRAPISDADVEAEEFNPFCGDRATLQLKLDGQGKVCGVSAQAEGCSIIQAATSMLCDQLHGKSLDEVGEIYSIVISPSDHEEVLYEELLDPTRWYLYMPDPAQTEGRIFVLTQQ